jgi:C4-dicarboxylate transporter
MLTQAEANAAFEGPTLDMANQFANIINLIMSAMFFHSILPLAIPIGCGRTLPAILGKQGNISLV